MGFRATLNFQKFKVALNPTDRILLNFAKRCILPCLSNIDNNKEFHCAVFKYYYKPLKLYFRVFLASNTVAMVNLSCHDNGNNVFTNGWVDFDTMIVASSDKEWL